MPACLVFAWLAYLILTGQPQFELNVFRPTVTLQGLNTLLIAGYLVYLGVHRRLPGPTRLDWPIAALILVYAAAIATSIYPRVSYEASLSVGMALVTFYVFHDLDILQPPLLMRGLAIVGAFAGAYALFQVFENYLDWLALARAVEGGIGGSLLPPAVPRITGVGDNVNVLAMALNLTLPFALAVALQPVYRFERLAGVIGALLILGALFFTLSRGAWLGTFAAIGSFGLLYALRNFDAGSLVSLQERIPKRLAIGVAVVTVLVLVVGAIAVASWDSRPEWIFRASLGPRADAAEVGLEIVRDKPLLGSGPYTYPLLYNIYSGQYPVENIHPHNGYVNVLVDIGIVGGLVLAVAGAMLAAQLYGSFRDATPRERVLVAACIASLVSLAVHSLADSPNVWTTALFPLAVVLALSLRLQPRPDPAVVNDRSLAPRLMVLALPMIMVASWIRFDIPHWSFETALDDLRNGEFADALLNSQDANAEDGSLAAYNIKYGVDSAILHLVIIDEKGRPDPRLLENAAAAFQQAIDNEPRSAIAYANLALVRLLQNDPPAATGAARGALNRTSSDGAVAMAAGSVLEWAGERDEAAFAYGLAVERDPGLVQSPFWAANADRLPLRQQAIESSGLTDCEIGRISAMYAGFPDDLSVLAQGCGEIVRASGDARDRADLAVILLALGRDEESIAEAQRAANQVPDNPFIRTSLGIALIGSGDLDRVRHELMAGAHLGDPDATLFLTYTYEPPAAESPVISRLKAIARPGRLPQPVLDRLWFALPASSPVVFDDGIQYYTLGFLYYRVRFLRESPTSILVPGEWLGFASPRSALIAEALKKH